MTVIAQHCEVLARTPATLRVMLEDLPDHWTLVNEGPGTWSPFDVLGHLLHGEHADWIPRVRRVLEHGEALAFDPFDRFAQFEQSKGKSVNDLLGAFASARSNNIAALRAMNLREEDLARRGTHPALGPTTLGQLLATWVVHDLGHVAQISRVMAKRYAEDVGPWSAYLRIIQT